MKPLLTILLTKATSTTGTLACLTLVFLLVHCLANKDALVDTMLTGFGSALLLALRTEPSEKLKTEILKAEPPPSSNQPTSPSI